MHSFLRERLAYSLQLSSVLLCELANEMLSILCSVSFFFLFFFCTLFVPKEPSHQTPSQQVEHGFNYFTCTVFCKLWSNKQLLWFHTASLWKGSDGVFVSHVMHFTSCEATNGCFDSTLHPSEKALNGVFNCFTCTMFHKLRSNKWLLRFHTASLWKGSEWSF